MGMLRGLADDAGGVGRALLAIPAACLPAARWEAIEEILPVRRMAVVSALITLAAGAAIGIRGFLGFAQRAADGLAQATLDAAARIAADPHGANDISLAAPVTASAMSPLAFMLATPTGWLADYLVVSAVVRAIAVWFDDPVGDPLLTVLDRLVLRSRSGASARRARIDRERLEGPEVPDRLYPAASVGVDDADLVVVASRRKPEWTPGTFVITPTKWYTLGEPFDRDFPGGLRRVYPLVEQKVPEVLRRGVSYSLPPLETPEGREPAGWRSPRAPARGRPSR